MRKLLFHQVGCALLISALSLVALFGLNFLSYATTDPNRLADHIAEAFRRGALIEAGYSHNDIRRGTHQFNDCLILQSTLLGRDDLVRWIISATVIGDENPCGRLRQLVEDRSPESVAVYPYHRYLFGARPFAAWLVGAVDLDLVRATLLVGVYSLFASTAVLSLLALSGWGRGPMRGHSREFLVGVASISIVFILFYRLQHFAQTFGHGFSELIIGLYLLSSLLAGRRAEWMRAALFGTFIAWFELLTGPALIGILLVLYLAVLAEDVAEENAALLRRVLTSCAMYGGTLITTLAIKVLVAAILYPGAAGDFFKHLAIRMQIHLLFGTPVPPAWENAANMTFYGPMQVLEALGKFLPSLVYDAGWATTAVVTAAALASVGSLILGFGRRRAAPCLLVGGSLALLPLWYFVFANHTVIHAFWMVRMIAAGLAGAALLPLCALAPPAWRIWQDRRYVPDPRALRCKTGPGADGGLG
jgi:hypothetical protein